MNFDNKNISETHSNNFTYFPQIDLLKGLAIVFVILHHTLPSYLLIQIFSEYHIWQAVPIFFILMGFTSVLSFSQKKVNNNIRSFYWRNYLIKKFWRIFVPFLIAFFISILFGIYNDINYYIGFGSFIGVLPVRGPGSYFISILFQYIFIAPFFYILYQKSPKLMLITFFSIDILFQLIAPNISVFNNHPNLYKYSILRSFSAIALGFYISDDIIKNGSVKIMSKKNRFILIGACISIIYLLLARFIYPELLRPQNVLSFSQNVLSYFYPLLIIIFFFNCNFIKYRNNIVINSLLEIGKASFHIFLVQILFFGFITKENLLFLGPFAIFAELIFILTIGWIFYFSQEKYYNYNSLFRLNKIKVK